MPPNDMTNNRKTVKHYDEPGHCHELTFSCYQRMPLLTNDAWRRLLCEAIERALTRHQFLLLAFVIMPEHVHLLVFPEGRESKTSRLQFAIKRPYSYRIKQLLSDLNSPLLAKLTIQERPGKWTFRYWQEGGGYDRNFTSRRAIENAIDYIHLNPVRRGLVDRPQDWKWSSATWYASNKTIADPDLPTLQSCPWELLADDN